MTDEERKRIRKIILELDVGSTNFTECYNQLMDVMNDMDVNSVVRLFANAVKEGEEKVIC